MFDDLKGKVALVTGAGSGLGKAAALSLAQAGAHLILTSRSKGEIEAVATQASAIGVKAFAQVADVSDSASVEGLFAVAREHFGQLDIVLANAGVNGLWAPIEEFPIEEWDKTIAINLRGTFLTVRHAVPWMKEKGGSVVIVSSINGTRTFTTAGASAYATTKAGQLAFGQMAALELAKYRIRVNVICPGEIESDIDDNTQRQNVKAAKVPAIYPDGTVPLTHGRPGKAADVADLVLFLASSRSRHITGTPIWIDGGQSLLM